MLDFTTTKPIFVVPFENELKEEQKLNSFMSLLYRSGVADLLSHRHPSANGGHPFHDATAMLATILFAFSDDKLTVRQIEKACRFDVRYEYLMSWVKPKKTSISEFIHDVIGEVMEQIFHKVTSTIMKDMEITPLDDVFIDGSKFEANANKYKFIWKPTNRKKKLMEKIDVFLDENDIHVTREEETESMFLARAVSILEERLLAQGMDPGMIVTGKGKRASMSVKAYLKCTKYLEKMLEYDEQMERCGKGRKSYYKTDIDATAMCLKEDYYSGKGSNMHAAYNVQLAVDHGIIIGFHVSQDRSDSQTLPIFIEKIHEIWDQYPRNVCADAGYGSISNYRYVHEKGIGNYLKYPSWEGETSGTRPSILSLDANGEIVCIAGKKAEPTETNTHQKKSGTRFMVVKGCRGCIYRKYCMRSLKKRLPNERVIETSVEWLRFKDEAKRNLASPKGIELRVNRSVQVEGTFGILKQDFGFERFRRRGLRNVSLEMMLTCLGANIRKYFRFIETGKLPDFWKAPESLKTEETHKISCVVRRGGKSTRNLRKQPNQIAKRMK